MKTNKIKKEMFKSIDKTKPLKLGTGSTLLNLACSSSAHWGFLTGCFYFLVGDSSSGKTFLSLTCLAEASNNERFKDYNFIYDNGENGALMNMEKFFGKAVASRLQPPKRNKDGSPAYSETVEQFYYNLDDATNSGKPFIYILDSMDVLSSKDEQNKFGEMKEAFNKNKITTGTMTDGKAKKNSAFLRTALRRIIKTNSILIIINQTRDNIGFGFDPKTRSGGRALSFYATVELWSSIYKKIYKNVKGKKRQLGILCQIKTKKNRITGKENVVNIPIYHSFGIDDIGGCVDYLIEEGHWKQSGEEINAFEFKLKEKKEKLIQSIESKGLEKDLKSITEETWKGIEDACSIKRKKRYE